MHVLAPAKINLHLRVGKRRDDGFHPLLTWMCTVGLFDKLTITPSPLPSFTCNWPDLPANNLVLQALQALPPCPPLSIHLEKHIPHGAGLGGGSSDAAHTLLAINSLLNLNLTPDHLNQIASTLGSDLSFFLHPPSALCQDRGTAVTPLPPPKPRHALLFLSNIHLSTPAVFRRFDDLHLGSDLHPLPDWTTLASSELLPHLINDLETPAFSLEPKLKEIKDFIESTLIRTVRMSGSGSSLFTLYDDPEEAKSMAHKISTTLNLRAIPVELAPIIRDDLHENLATQ